MIRKHPVNNEIYKQFGHVWWDEERNSHRNVLRFAMNPLRLAYFMRMLRQAQGAGGKGRRVLDVGCGGGYLAEEFAKAGFEVTGIDPAEESLACARAHAAENGLAITYLPGSGEHIPFNNASFDIVLCCDVLEHVDAIGPVLGEISRVLRSGGFFFYDTINRTLASWFAVIKLMQDWQPKNLVEPNGHVWRHFIKPRELSAAMAEHGLKPTDICGIAPSANPVDCLLDIHRLSRGRLSFRELGERAQLAESRSTRVAYMGYAVRQDRR